MTQEMNQPKGQEPMAVPRGRERRAGGGPPSL
jgi:hypothetical protein